MIAPLLNQAEEQRVVMPLVSIRETEKEIVVEAEMPGLKKENISVDLEGDQLIVIGKQHEQTPKDFTVVYQERTPFEYRRFFTIETEIDSQNISAQYENGILSVTLPKSERVQPKRIAVQ
jgi:HSP20 family protein